MSRPPRGLDYDRGALEPSMFAQVFYRLCSKIQNTLEEPGFPMLLIFPDKVNDMALDEGVRVMEGTKTSIVG